MITLTTFDRARAGFRCRDLRQALYDAGEHLMNGVIVNLHGDEHIARRRLENRLFRRDTFAWYEAHRTPAIIEAVLRAPLADGRGDLLPIARRTMMRLSVDVAGVDLTSGTDHPPTDHPPTDHPPTDHPPTDHPPTDHPPVVARTFDPDGSEPDGREPDGPEPDADGRDHDVAGADVFERFYELMNRLARASIVAHATGDAAAIVADGDAALATFDVEFFRPARARRQTLLDAVHRGELDADALPRDVLTTLLRNQDDLHLPDDVVLREVAYFPWVGSHSTSAQLVHAMHHMFEWLDEHPADRQRLIADDHLRQRFVHESMRLHPASPVALRTATCDVDLDGVGPVPAGTTVVIDIATANRDPSRFGPDTDRFDPHRSLADGVAPWGLSFGHGTHACLGQELAGGLTPADCVGQHLLGSVALMAGVLLAAGARPDPDDPAELDLETTRVVWGRYPVVFDPALAP